MVEATTICFVKFTVDAVDFSTAWQFLLVLYLFVYPLVNIQKAMEAMAHRNRWFTEL
jgi:hypothetical protein